MKKKNSRNVRAVIELKITPQRKTGFGKIAGKVSKYAQVDACFLMSGAYDLLVFASGDSLQDVAEFVSSELSTIDGVLSTSTHFMLKTYKASGEYAFEEDKRLPIV
jgi:DNA-binding Lrp family transcriptional regulator